MAPEQIHVAALAFPFASHPGSLVALVRRLSAAAPNIVFSFHCTAKLNATLLSETDKNIKAFDVSDGVPKGHVFSGHREEGINLFLAVSPANFSESIRAAEAEIGRRVSCLITEAFLWFSSDLAAEMGVPWIPYWTSAAFALSIHFRTDLIREKIGNKEVDPLKSIPGMSKIEIHDLPEGVVSGDLTSPFSELLRQMGLKVPYAAAVVVNSFEELEPVVTPDLKSNFKKLLCVGPAIFASPSSLSFSDEYGCIPWLDGWGPASVAYVAFGTIVVLSPEEIQALAEALEDAQFPFLWSIAEDKRHFLPNGFLERTKEKGKLVSWAPQVQVLTHASVGAYVTHCGWNSVTEAFSGGKPMISRTFFADQSLNTRMVESVWEVGVEVPGGRFTKSAVVGALKRVLSSEEGDKMRRNFRRIREEAIKAFAPEGSSTANFKTLVDIISKK